MRCPRCQTENPPGRGFCIKCAYPLPEEPRPEEPKQEEQAPVYEPIRFDNAPVYPNPYPYPNPYGYPYEMPKKRIGLGVAALVLAILGLINLNFVMSFFTVGPEYVAQAIEMGMLDIPVGMTPDPAYLSAMCEAVYGFFGLIVSTLGTIFGGVALSKLRREPKRYRGKGMYITATVLAAVSLIGCAVGFFHAMTVL